MMAIASMVATKIQKICMHTMHNKVLYIYGILAYNSIIAHRNTLESVFVNKAAINLQEHVEKYKRKIKANG